jgi:hypothetical protein
MNISQSVNEQITHMAPGQFFTYQDIAGFADNGYAVIKALSRQFERLGLVKVKKGLFYKEVIGSFGPMAPKDSDVIRYFTTVNNKTVGYLTGPALYHRWGLTTQVPAEITIATSTNKREKVVIAGLRVVTIPAQGEVNDKTIPLLQFLDVIKHIDCIPDADNQLLLANLTQRLRQYSSNQIDMMEDMALIAYGAKVRALLGALFASELGRFSGKLYQSLNPTSRYKIGLIEFLSIHAKRWYLVNR